MTVQDKFLLAGVMGWPVMHSRSPLIHNHWLAQHGLQGRYVPLAIPPEGLAAALRALPALGFSGCNLTLPHKQAAMDIVDEVHDSARAIGAISCVTVRSDGTLLGSNNDAFGFIRNLRQQQPNWRADAGPAVVIGPPRPIVPIGIGSRVAIPIGPDSSAEPSGTCQTIWRVFTSMAVNMP